jgi:hypothetical protein
MNETERNKRGNEDGKDPRNGGELAGGVAGRTARPRGRRVASPSHRPVERLRWFGRVWRRRRTAERNGTGRCCQLVVVALAWPCLHCQPLQNCQFGPGGGMVASQDSDLAQ